MQLQVQQLFENIFSIFEQFVLKLQGVNFVQLLSECVTMLAFYSAG